MYGGSSVHASSCPEPPVTSTATKSHALVKFDAGFWEAIFSKNLLDLLPMIPLQNYRVVLGSPATCTVGLQLSGKVPKVNTLSIDALYDCRCLAPLSHFQPDLYGLLFHT